MANKLVAVAVNNRGDVSVHAGRAKHWQVYAVTEGTAPELVWSITLTGTGSLHEWHVNGDGERHPLHFVDAAIAGSAGEGVTNRLGSRGVELVTTIEVNPAKAVADYMNGTLEPGLPHEEQDCCHHDLEKVES